MGNTAIIQVRYLDGFRFQRAILAGIEEVISHEKELNKINVFPIPDKDTGSNLKKTFKPLLERYPLWESSIDSISLDIADRALDSALGYSGIIFAQFISGFADVFKDYKRVFIDHFVKAAEKAVTRAYESLEHPQEGTILTVFKEWSDEIRSLSQRTNDFVPLLKNSHEKAQLALKETQHQLEVLKKHKVVDAGGKAFTYFLEGIIHFIEKGKLQRISPQRKQLRIKRKAEDKVKKAQFCAECCVRRENLDRLQLIEKLNTLGTDLIFYSSLHFAKIHINTNNPENVFYSAAQFGELTTKKIFKFDPEQSANEKTALALVSDTTCDIPDEYVEDNDLYFIPVKVQASDKIFIDKVTIIPEEFYKIMSSSPVLPKTSQPSFVDFTRVYEHLTVHYKSIISLQLSGNLSGTFQTALQAAHKVAPKRITALDGKNISVGLGLIMLEGIKAVKENLSHDIVLDRLKQAIDDVKIFIGIPTLKYLVKGGRVTKTKGFIAKIFKINPILSVNQEGALEPIGKIRGRKRLEQKVFDLASEKIINIKKTYPEYDASVAIAHTDSPQLGRSLAEKINQSFGLKAAMVMNAAPVLGAHSGPGALGIAVLKSSKK
ncbi:MAG: DegV family protein [Candidatus Aminicenantaceae bacterium]